VASPDGEHLMVPDADGSAELRHLARPPTMLRGHRAVIDTSLFSRDGKHLFTSSRDGTLRRWDVATGEGTILVEDAPLIRQLAVAADGRVAFAQDGAIRVIALDGTARAIPLGPKWSAWEFEPVKDRLLLRGGDQRLAVLDGDRLIELPTDHRSAVGFAVSPDGTRIAGALQDRTVRVWDAATGRVLAVLRGHSDLVMDVAFSPDGTLLASSSYDKTVRIWQPGTNRVRVLRGHSGSVNQVAWSSPKRLVTGSRDGTLRIWDVPPLEPPTADELADHLQRATTAKIDRDRPTTDVPPPPRRI
jgi:WD40 repeat protein